MSTLTHLGRKLHFEHLGDEEIVYKRRMAGNWVVGAAGGMPAKRAVTDCCELRPIRYFPDWPSNSRWWLICPGCKYAISANGDAL